MAVGRGGSTTATQVGSHWCVSTTTTQDCLVQSDHGFYTTTTQENIKVVQM